MTTPSTPDRLTPARLSAAAAVTGASALALTLSACLRAPVYDTPPAGPVPQAVTDRWAGPPPPSWMHPAAPADAIVRGAWWRPYADDGLNRLIARLDADNPTLAQAEARRRAALAALTIARAAYLPTVGGNGTIGLTGTDQGLGIGNGVGGRGSTSLGLGISASWVPDFWGRVASQVAGAADTLESTTAARETSRLSLQSQVAQSWFTARGEVAQMRLLEDGIKAYREALRITNARFHEGISDKTDVTQAQVQLANAQAQLEESRLTLDQNRNALAALLGRTPAEAELPPIPGLDADTIAVLLPPVPLGLPSELLQRRPDIASAERGVAAANAAIGVAWSALYPNISLSAGLSTGGATLGDIGRLSNAVWTLGTGLTQPIYAGGALQAGVEQARANLDVTIGGYRQTVVSAFSEVEDNLATLNRLESEQAAQTRARDAAAETLRLENFRYREGVVDYLQVVTAQNADLTARRATLTLAERRVLGHIGLVASLGGGWTETTLAEEARAAPAAGNNTGAGVTIAPGVVVGAQTVDGARIPEPANYTPSVASSTIPGGPSLTGRAAPLPSEQGDAANHASATSVERAPSSAPAPTGPGGEPTTRSQDAAAVPPAYAPPGPGAAPITDPAGGIPR